MEKIHVLKSAVHQLPEKKRYAEFVTAVLSVPVIITVLIMNVNNLKKSETPAVTVASNTTPTPTIHPAVSPRQSPSSTKPVTRKAATEPTAQPTPVTTIAQTGCIKQVGPVSITSPSENETVTRNPVSIDIERTGGTSYCEIVWSYRINNDSWSEYTDKSIALYNLSPGKKNLELKVKSIASPDSQTLTRIFTIPESPTPQPAASASASQQ